LYDSGVTNFELFDAIKHGDHGLVLPYFDEFPEYIDVINLRSRGETSREWDERTPIHAAAKHGHLELVKELVAREATVYSHPLASYPAVIVADWAKQQAVVDYFLDEIPDQAQGTFGIGVACNLAGRQGWIKQVQAHLDRDHLSVHQRGWIGDTPLHWPSHNGFIEIVRLLLEAGGDPNAEENGWIGGTPLHWASERHGSIIRLLVAYGAEVNARVTKSGSNHLGGTPLIWCARQRDDSAEAAQTLLELGADPSLTDAVGKTALDWAQELGHSRVATVLTA
jgi:ankyrin repeat protein